MPTYPFLSNDWITEAEKLRDEYQDRLPESPVAVKANLVINELPDQVAHPDLEQLDDQPVVKAHIDTDRGQVMVNRGHLEEPEMTITTDYNTAVAAFVTQNQEEVMSAFMSGKILVEGDASKLLALQAPPSDPEAAAIGAEMFGKLQSFTELPG